MDEAMSVLDRDRIALMDEASLFAVRAMFAKRLNFLLSLCNAARQNARELQILGGRYTRYVCAQCVPLTNKCSSQEMMFS